MRKKRIPRLKIKGRIASKVMEDDLISKAKMLRDNPGLIVPDCEMDCLFCPFKKTEARLEKIIRFKDDPDVLAKFARRGDKLARAYAATIGLIHEKRMPYLGTATYPGGTITYAARGKTSKEKLIGVQNLDSPKWRVLSVLDLVQKKGLHFYSWGDNFVCTGRIAKPPEDYVRSAADSVGASRLEGESFVCPHNPVAGSNVTFDWLTAGRKVVLCHQCATKSKNTLRELAEGMAVPNALNEFEISISRPLKVVAGEAECRNALDVPLDNDLVQDYAGGKLGDKELIEKHLQRAKEDLAEKQMRLFIQGENCFGEDMEAFIKNLTDDDLEQKALSGLLAEVHNPVVVDSGDSVNKILTSYWSGHGRQALAVVVSEELAEKYYGDGELEKESPLKLIRKAIEESSHASASARIPKYSQLSQYGSFVDKIVRAYKTRGTSNAVAILDAEKSADHRMRSITHGFYLALGITTKSWKFTDEEKEYGNHLQKYAAVLLESKDAEQHHEAFSNLLREAGSVEELKRL
ncbi:MAG TPA: hypothetical protein VGB78_10325 [Thermoplasmata archaeon]